MNYELIASLKEELEGAQKSLDSLKGMEELYPFGVNSITSHIGMLKSRIALLENDGYAEFTVLMDLDGNFVSDKLINTKYGKAYVIQNSNGTATFISPYGKKSTIEKKGYKIGKMMFKAEMKPNSSKTFRTYEEDEEEY